MSVIIAVNTMKIITFELWFLSFDAPLISLRLQCRINGYMSCICGNFSKAQHISVKTYHEKRTNKIHLTILLPWLAQIEQITYSRSENQLRFSFLCLCLVQLFRLETFANGFMRYIKPFFLACFRVFFLPSFFSFQESNSFAQISVTKPLTFLSRISIVLESKQTKRFLVCVCAFKFPYIYCQWY